MRLKDALPAEMFEELIDDVDELVFVIGRELRILVANRASAYALGYEVSRLSGSPFMDLISPEKAESLLALIRTPRDRRGGATAFVTKAGAIISVRFLIIPIRSDDSPASSIIVAKRDPPDISQRSALFLRSYERRIVADFCEPLLIIDAVTRVIRDCNEAMESLCGFTRAELLGKRPYELGSGQKDHQLDRDVEDRAGSIIVAGGVFREALDLPRKNGTPIPCELLGLPFYRLDEGIDSVLLIVFDRSSRRLKLSELRELVERMNAIGSRLSDIVSSIPKESPISRLSDLGLSHRQVMIADLIAKGMSSKEIGYALGISDSTVRNHLSAMFRKLGVSSRLSFLRLLSDRRIRIH